MLVKLLLKLLASETVGGAVSEAAGEAAGGAAGEAVGVNPSIYSMARKAKTDLNTGIATIEVDPIPQGNCR